MFYLINERSSQQMMNTVMKYVESSLSGN